MRYQDYDNEYLSRATREALVAGFSEIVERQMMDGFEPYYMNFMFHNIHSNRKGRMDVMVAEVERVHRSLMMRIVRCPRKAKWAHLRPVFIGAHDLPVWKNEKETGQQGVVNGGLHFNVVALIPPSYSHKPKGFRPDYQARLHESLEEHIALHSRHYLNEVLARIHVTPIRKGVMIDYTLKTFKSGLVSMDSVQIWN
jgi:hypothetical protein